MKKLLFIISMITLILGPVVQGDEEANPDNQATSDEYYQPSPEQNYIAVISPAPTWSNRYFGFNFSTAFTNIDRNIAITGTDSYNKQDKKIFGYLGGVYSGLGANLGNFYAGTELGVYFNSLSRNFSQTLGGYNTQLSIKQPLILTVDIMPGYLTRDREILLYGRLGVAGSMMKLDFKDLSNSKNDTTNEKLIFGWRAGVGVQYLFCNFFSMRLEYTYSRYNDNKKDFTDNSILYSYQGQVIGVNQINLGMTFHF